MNKASLVEKVHTELGGTKVQAEQVVEMIFNSIVDEVSKTNEVSISGFGIFESRKRKERMGRNPKTGEAIKIAASKSPKFRPAKAFKDAVKGQ